MRPYSSWKPHSLALVSPLVFFGVAYTQYKAKLEARREQLQLKLSN